MSEHLWAEENLTVHVMGGLAGEERERIEAHIAECAECAREFDTARDADRKLQELFMSTRPNAALEDQVIQTLRQEPFRVGWFRAPRSFKVAVAAAAAILLAVCGAGVTSLMERNVLHMATLFDDSRSTAENNLKQLGVVAQGLVDATTQTVKIQGMSVEGRDAGVELKDADALAKEVRAGAEKLLDIADEKEGKLKGKLNLNTAVLGDGEFKSRAYAPVPSAADAAPGSSPPPFGESKAGEWGRKPDNGVAVDKPDRGEETKLGDKRPGSGKSSTRDDTALALPKAPVITEALPEAGEVIQKANEGKPGWGYGLNTGGFGRGFQGGRVQFAPVFQYSNNKPSAHYFKPGDTFTKGTTPSEPAQPAQQDDKSLLGKGEQKLGFGRSDEAQKKEEKHEANPAAGIVASLPPQAKQAEPKKDPETKTGGRKIIRSGDIEFEIDSFDSATAIIIGLVNATKGGFVSTINSDKLPNGKVRGSVVVRMPPEELDNFVLDLRKELGKAGELKSQRIGSQDITKQYTDLESRLRAARTMEERLIKMIAEGKGVIKDLFLVEKELGVWRTKIEEIEGELRYYANMVSLSTLNVLLTEKEIRTAALVKESERVKAGIEVEDVEKALRDALKAILENKGRVTRSELKQHGAGQFNALLHFETPPEQAGFVQDRLKQLGNMVRLEIDRVQQTEGGATAPKDGKIKRGETQFFISIYNLANVAPRETVVLRIAATSVPDSYQKLREAVGKAKGRVVNAQLNEQDPQNVGALVEFDIRRVNEPAVLLAIKDAGESITRQVSRVPEGENVTDAKILFRIELVNAASIPPRETVIMKLAATDVPSAYQALRAILNKVSSKVVNAQLIEQDRQNITANLDFSINRTDETALQETLTKTTEVISRQLARQPESAQVSDARVQYRIEINPASRIPPREVVTLAIEVTDVQKRLDDLKKKVNDLQGRAGPVQMALERSGRVTARASFDVPFAQAESLAADFKKTGIVRVHQVATDQQAPEGKLAIARFDVTLSNEVLLPQDEGLWAQLQKGVSVSLRGLTMSVSFLVVGLLFVGPWLLVVYVVVVLIRRMWRTSPAAPR